MNRILIISVAVLLILLVAFCADATRQPLKIDPNQEKEFDKIIWRQGSNERYYIVHSLLYKHSLVGLTLVQVYELLGPPDEMWFTRLSNYGCRFNLRKGKSASCFSASVCVDSPMKSMKQRFLDIYLTELRNTEDMTDELLAELEQKFSKQIDQSFQMDIGLDLSTLPSPTPRTIPKSASFSNGRSEDEWLHEEVISATEQAVLFTDEGAAKIAPHGRIDSITYELKKGFMDSYDLELVFGPGGKVLKTEAYWDEF